MDTGSGRHGQSPDVRRATSQAKRFKSKGSSPRMSTIDLNCYGGVEVRLGLSLTILVGEYLIDHLASDYQEGVRRWMEGS